MTALPEGWTRHELNGSVFYFNRSTNTVQPHPPSLPSSSSSPAPSAPPPPTPPPETPRKATDEAADKTPQNDEEGAHAPQQQQQQQQHQQQEPKNKQQEQDNQSHDSSAVQPQAEPAFGPTASNEQALALAPRFHPQPESTATLPQATLVSVSPPTMQSLRVLVPPPGLRAGQKLEFTAPGGPGAPPQRFSVTAPEPILAGSTLTVRYPEIPAAAAVAAPPPGPRPQVEQRPAFPVPQVEAASAEDRAAMIRGWWLYGVGLASLCCCPVLSVCFWVVAAGGYFCMPKTTRARRQMQRKPAYTALYTLIGAALLGGVLCAVHAAHGHRMHWSMRHHQHHGHEHHHGHHHEHHHDFDLPDVQPMDVWKAQDMPSVPTEVPADAPPAMPRIVTFLAKAPVEAPAAADIAAMGDSSEAAAIMLEKAVRE